MVRGLEKFREHFKGHTDKYILIGGAACDLAMDEVGSEFRATKDLDIVLCVEAIDTSFVSTFWEFIQAGHYNNRQKSTGKKLFYRFDSPEDNAYPLMLELFSRIPDALSHTGMGHLTPIPISDEVSSLSAILLDEVYYNFIHSGKRELNGLSIAGPEYIIPLKARAWLDLTERRTQGEKVDSKDIRKHKNDVFRLFSIVELDNKIETPDPVAADLKRFMDALSMEKIDLSTLGYQSTTVEILFSKLKDYYGIGD